MPDLRGLTIIIVGPDPDRFAAALTLASASAALGGPTRLFADERAVPLLRRGGPHASRIDEARALGASVVACQTGLAGAGLTPADLVEEVEMGGLVGLLATLGDARLVTV